MFLNPFFCVFTAEKCLFCSSRVLVLYTPFRKKSIFVVKFTKSLNLEKHPKKRFMNITRQYIMIFPKKVHFFVASLILSILFLSSCSFIKESFGISESSDIQSPEYEENEVYFREKSYPVESFQEPSGLEDLMLEEQKSLFRLRTVEYEISYELDDETLKQEIIALRQRKSTDDDSAKSDKNANILDAFSLEKYVRDTNEAIIAFLQSKGYYSAEIVSQVDYDVFPVKITISITPNEIYKISKANIVYPNIFKSYIADSAVISISDTIDEHIEEFDETEQNKDISQLAENIILAEDLLAEELLPEDMIPPLPRSLFDFGLTDLGIATSDTILEAEKQVLPWFRNHGFPFAEIVFSRYFAFQDSKDFEARVRVNPNDFVLFGDIVIEGSNELSLEYIEIIKTWEKGDRWDESKVEMLRNDLFSLGIFSNISIVPVKITQRDETKKESRKEREKRVFTQGDDYIVQITLKDSTQRSFGGGFAYNTSRGFGAKLFWEHRNILDSAEKLSLDLDYWEDLQRAILRFEVPDVFVRSLDFNISTELEREVFDAYTTTSLITDIGFEQPLASDYVDNLRLSYFLQSVIGNEEDNHTNIVDDYYYFGLPIRLTSRATNSALDPSEGYIFSLQAAPYVGVFRDTFSVFQVEGSFSTYFELMENKKLVAAIKAKAGAIFSEDVDNIPPPLRFYAGGANSVRGYSYQDLGPENKYGEAVGGASLFEASFELRYKYNEEIAIVPFIDMGNVYDSYEIDFTEDFKFGTGIGLRYYTLAGPLRLDLAVPFDDKNGFGFKDFQVYISIGQSF